MSEQQATYGVSYIADKPEGSKSASVSMKSQILSTMEFISRCEKVHGKKYDYSLANYTGSKNIVSIICPIHGIFSQIASHHMRGCGCPKCYHSSHKSKVCGVGINDLDEESKKSKAYSTWRGMLRRCYDVRSYEKNPSYVGCSVCDEWLIFSNFKRWFDENYREGYHLDKDIIKRENKIYCPEKSRFVPRFVNTVLLNRRRDRGVSPIGSTFLNGKYFVSINKFGRHYYLGSYDSAHEAFIVYKKEKEKYIKDVADIYFKQGKIDKAIYDSLLQYKVNFND